MPLPYTAIVSTSRKSYDPDVSLSANPDTARRMCEQLHRAEPVDAAGVIKVEVKLVHPFQGIVDTFDGATWASGQRAAA